MQECTYPQTSKYIGYVFHCTDGQMTRDVDILNELKKLQKAQDECTKKFSELEEYKFRVLYLENTVKDLQGAVKNLESKNKELLSAKKKLEDDKRHTVELDVNNYESNTEIAVEGLPSVDDRRVLNATYPLQENVDKSMKRDDNRIRFAMKRSFTVRPKPTNQGPTNSGQVMAEHVAFTVGLSAKYVKVGYWNTVIFDSVVTNIGSAYQPNTGIFTVPFKGAYVFSLTVTVAQGQSAYLHVFIDGSSGDNFIFADSTSSSGYTSVTKEWILEVNKGSEVWIRCGAVSEIYGSMDTIWSGYLLLETN